MFTVFLNLISKSNPPLENPPLENPPLEKVEPKIFTFEKELLKW